MLDTDNRTAGVKVFVWRGQPAIEWIPTACNNCLVSQKHRRFCLYLSFPCTSLQFWEAVNFSMNSMPKTNSGFRQMGFHFLHWSFTEFSVLLV